MAIIHIRGEDLEIASFAGGLLEANTFFQAPPSAYQNQEIYQVPWLTAYSMINKVQPQQFHLNAAQIRLPVWNIRCISDPDQCAAISKLVLSKVIPAVVPSLPVSSPVVACNDNNNNSKYSDTEVILIGVLPVCLLFVLVVV